MPGIQDYKGIVGGDEINELVRLANRIKGIKIVHVNATRYGGGVAEILKSLMPLMKSLGLDARWEVIKGDREFFTVTKSIHNALQGNKSIKLSNDMKEHYININRVNAREIDLDADLVIIHDPQPLPLIEFGRKDGKWVWRCHIDLTDPNIEVWSFIKKYVLKYDALIFTMEKYVHKELRSKKIYIIPPAIDPLSEKNKEISVSEVLRILNKFGVDPDRPIIGQVSRFDPWKNTLGVIDLYRKVREKVPKVQLLLIGSFAHDDPEGFEWYRKTIEYAGNDRDIHILTDKDGVGDREVNAFQRSFSVALQLSIREGFGLAVTEALWKGVPVVATNVGGIPLQVIDGVTGFLVNNISEAIERTILLLKRPWLSRILGHNGREHVRRNFLITRLLKDHLRIALDLLTNK